MLFGDSGECSVVVARGAFEGDIVAGRLRFDGGGGMVSLLAGGALM